MHAPVLTRVVQLEASQTRSSSRTPFLPSSACSACGWRDMQPKSLTSFWKILETGSVELDWVVLRTIMHECCEREREREREGQGHRESAESVREKSTPSTLNPWHVGLVNFPEQELGSLEKVALSLQVLFHEWTRPNGHIELEQMN